MGLFCGFCLLILVCLSVFVGFGLVWFDLLGSFWFVLVWCCLFGLFLFCRACLDCFVWLCLWFVCLCISVLSLSPAVLVGFVCLCWGLMCLCCYLSVSVGPLAGGMCTRRIAPQRRIAPP